MPLFQSEAASCTDEAPCPGDCARCEAERILTDADWYLVRFYERVAHQWINQTPMGTEKGSPLILTPRLEGYAAALRIYGYPKAEWAWLVDGAVMLHSYIHKMAKPNYGKLYRDVTPEDVAPPEDGNGSDES